MSSALLRLGCVQVDLSDNELCGIRLKHWLRGEPMGTFTLEGVRALSGAIAVSGSLTDCNLLNNEMDSETATMLAQISKERRISLCGIMPEHTEANFREQQLTPANATLIAAALEFRGSLTKVRTCCSPSLLLLSLCSPPSLLHAD